MILTEWILNSLRERRLLRECWGPEKGELQDACIDSRKIREGEIYFALKGEHTDGHHFARKALDGKAGAVVLSDPEIHSNLYDQYPDQTILLVDDVLETLQFLASRWVRSIEGLDVIGITGSNGKTGTKNYCAAAMSVLGNTASSRGNLNNLIGLPLCTLGIPRDTRYLVAEMGCSSFGEIARLAELFKPRAGVITNIGDAHLELLGDRNGVARAKGELAAALPKDGLLLLWGEDPYAGTLAKFGDPLTQVRTFGFGDGNLLKLEDLGPDGAGRRMRVEGKELRLPSPMHHAILQAGAAWLLAREYGAEVQDLAEALEAAQPEGNRSSLYRIGDWIFMDDSYNANPDSLRAALRWLAETPCEGRRWALLGDMLEMGPGGENVHREMGREVAQMGGIGLMTLGPLAAAMTEGGETAGLEIAQKFENHTSLATALLEKLGKGDVILVKGSRGMEMEKIIEIMENATGLSRKAIR